MSRDERLNVLADQIAAEGMVLRAADVRAGAVEIARQRHEIERLRAALSDAPILSKYHGHHGFEVERFIVDYEVWKRRAMEPKPQPARCAECDRYYADPPSKLCPGCQAYREHQS